MVVQSIFLSEKGFLFIIFFSFPYGAPRLSSPPRPPAASSRGGQRASRGGGMAGPGAALPPPRPAGWYSLQRDPAPRGRPQQLPEGDYSAA